MPPRAIVGQHEWIAGPAERPSPDRCTDRKKSWKSGKRSAAPTGDFFVDRKCLSWIGWALPTSSYLNASTMVGSAHPAVGYPNFVGWHGQVLLPVRCRKNMGKRVRLPMPPIVLLCMAYYD